jgi:DNA-binding MarR family transcriptional regulator
MNYGELVELIGRRWSILVKLAERRFFVKELAEELGKSPPQLVNELKDLEKEGLVRWESEKGNRRKYFRTSDYANAILATIQTFEPRGEGNVEEWQIKEFLTILGDKNFSESLRLSYSESFRNLCAEHPTDVLSIAETRNFLEKVADDKGNDNFTVSLRRSVSAILLHMSRLGDWSKWVLEKLYPIFVKNMEDDDKKVRLCAIKMVGKIVESGIKPSLKAEFKDKLFRIWFSTSTKEESDFGNEVARQLASFSSKELFEKVRTRSGIAADRSKAEALLEKLKYRLKPR